MSKIAIVVTGCGFKDGSEITETVSCLIALSELNVEFSLFAPELSFKSTCHLSGTEGESRNSLKEAARIARGDIAEISDLKSTAFDALIFPGGYGAATQLSNWAEVGAKATVLPSVKSLIEEFHFQSKPIGAFCIAPTLIARVLGETTQVSLTIGNDEETAQEIEKTGARHIDCVVTDFLTDRENKVVTTPAYMCEATAFEVFTGIRNAIKEITEMA